jgi:hypothetical protein
MKPTIDPVALMRVISGDDSVVGAVKFTVVWPIKFVVGGVRVESVPGPYWDKTTVAYATGAPPVVEVEMVRTSEPPGEREDDGGETAIDMGLTTTLEFPGITVILTDEFAEMLKGDDARTLRVTLYHTGDVGGAVQLS